MRCPTVNQLPPARTTGWPWTAESPQLPDTMPDGAEWPLISIVTPSLNQGPYLEETIRSVLLQGYPRLEYVIIDGGSADGSVELIRKYEPWLSYWVSEPDSGQSNAINKGFAHTTGELLAWLNSDDAYEPGALALAATFQTRHPQVDLMYGASRQVDGAGALVKLQEPPEFDLEQLLESCFIAQDAAFFTRRVWQAAGPLNESYRYALDYELWLRFCAAHAAMRMPGVLGVRRLVQGTKSIDHPEAFYPEIIDGVQRFFARNNLPEALRGRQGRLLAKHHLHAWAQYTLSGSAEQGALHIVQALQMNPGLRQSPEEILKVIDDHGHDPGCEASRLYLARLFDNLPPAAAAIKPLRPKAAFRIAFWYVRRQPPGERRRWLLRHLSDALRDWRWLRQRPLQGIVLQMLAGERLTRWLVMHKPWQRV